MKTASRILALSALAMSAGIAAAVRSDAAAANVDPFDRNPSSDGRHNYRGGPGNRSFQRAALKKRNQARHRKACRG
jgi:hypothetical protein